MSYKPQFCPVPVPFPGKGVSLEEMRKSFQLTDQAPADLETRRKEARATDRTLNLRRKYLRRALQQGKIKAPGNEDGTKTTP